MGNMNNKNIFSSGAAKSLLLKDVKINLQRGMTVGFKNDCLDLSSNMIPELCEWLIKIEGKVETLQLKINKMKINDSLYYNEITSTGASTLFDMLRTTNSSIKAINFYQNKQINDECMNSVGEYIKYNKSIEEILLGCNKISDAGIEILAPYLDGNTTFKGLVLNNNKGITDKSIPLLVKVIESSHIENMGISYTSIAQEDMIYVSLACNRIKYGLTKLNLASTGVNDEDMIKICDAMKKYGVDKLKEIHLYNNKITSKGASVLFDTLRECNSVVSKLDLHYNQIDDECMKQLGEYVQDNEHLEILGIGYNKVTDKGIEIISEYLIGNTKLKELDLRGNKGITDVSTPYLIEIAKKSCITNTLLWSTSISTEKEQEIEELLKTPIEQREIPIKSNSKSAAKISAST